MKENTMNKRPLSLTSLAAMLLVAPLAFAQEPAKTDAKKPSKEELIKKLEQTLTGAKMTGRFTVAGKEDKAPAAEEYTIVSAKKVDGDVWLLSARIKYGGTDKTLPVPLEIQWAGDTPIITMTDMAIPGLGDNFSTRVVIYDGMYAGTWAHGPVKGHMYGTITKGEEKKEEKK
jgi:hypothetical protein